jgi:type I restriction enzyme M protein
VQTILPLADVEKRLWDAADELRANSKLKSSEYSVPVLGLIFLRHAEYRFAQAEREIAKETSSRRTPGKTDYQARGVMYLPPQARFSYLLNLPEEADVGKAINEAMKAIEAENPDLKDALPKTYGRIDKPTLVTLLKNFSPDSMFIEGDAFGKIYEYFLGKFAMSEGQKGGEFFTPESIVKLIVEIIEPFGGRIFDPACGSGGMFVHSARFVEEHRKNGGANGINGSNGSASHKRGTLSIHGQERVGETVRLCRMNLTVHGLTGDIRQANTYYEDLHGSVGKFDFVMANPPFNVDKVDKERIKNDRRFPRLPKADNANYLWIQLFHESLNAQGRAGFVMASSTGDAGGSERDIRQELIESGDVECIVSVGPNFFYTVGLPCTLWFLNKGKKGTPHEDKVLFLDARPIFRQIDRAHRDFTPAQLEFLANVARLYRGEKPDFADGSGEMVRESFPDLKYRDVRGLCKAATRKQIKDQNWSLNPGRYVEVAARAADDFVFLERLQELNEELETLTAQAHDLEERISDNVAVLLGNTQ